MPEADNPISLTVTKFPNNLIIHAIDNIVSIQFRNRLNQEAEFKFAFEGENLKVDLKSNEFSNKVKFGPNETKSVDLSLTPLNNGTGKLIINAYWIKLVEFTEKVQKIRETISSKNVRTISGTEKIIPLISTDFDPSQYFNPPQKSDIKNLEKDTQILQDELKESENKSNERTKTILKRINENLQELAISYLSRKEFYKALETALKISDQQEQLSLYHDLIRAHSIVNFDESLQVITQLKNKNMKFKLIRDLAIDFALVDLQKIKTLLNLVDEKSHQLEVVLHVIGKLAPKNVNWALKLFDYISDDIFKLKILLNLAEIIHQNKKEDEMLEVVGYLKDIALKISNSSVLESISQNTTYNLLKDAIYLLGELWSPETADSIIKKISKNEIKEKLTRDLFEALYIMVEEVRLKVVPTLLFSQYYNLNTYSSKPSNELQNFALQGGNVSDNILTDNFNLKFAFISLFSLNFSIFPFIDRIYSEIKLSNNQSFAYYIYPTINNHDEEELRVMQRTISQFFPLSKLPTPLMIFNLDFIPYLGQPTVILSGESDMIKTKIEKRLENKAKILIDHDMFDGGKSTSFLKEIFQSDDVQIINLVLSYEFINDYNIFKEFIESLI